MAGRLQGLRQFLRHLAVHGSLAVLASGTALLAPAPHAWAAPPVQLGTPQLNNQHVESAADADRWQPARVGGTLRNETEIRSVAPGGANASNVGIVRVGQPSEATVRWRIRDDQAGSVAPTTVGPTTVVPRAFAAPEYIRELRTPAASGRVIRPVNGESEFEPQDHPRHDPFGDRAPVAGAVLNGPSLDPPADDNRYAEAQTISSSDRRFAPGIRVASQPPGELPQLPSAPPLSGPPLRPLPAAPPRTVDESEPAAPTTEQPAEQATEQPANPAADPVDPAPPTSRPLSAPKSGATQRMAPRQFDPQRNAEFCQQTYNERNCCTDGNECQAHRERVRSHPLSKISLDITPTCNLSTRRSGEQTKCGFPFEDAPSRVWRDRHGETLAEGRVMAMANLRLDITNDAGQTVRVRVRDLGEDDICFLAAWCGIPSECRLDDVALTARNWSPITMTWKASGLCHRPTYFEEVQLERYGHTAGPFAQPILSGAHFFVNIAVLPYKMGIHPPNECQYSLGYYRPGNCAPWLVPPIPLSVRGAAAETAAVLGGVFIFP